MSKEKYVEKQRLTTYQVDQNKVGRASGIWQIMQGAACHQMKTQKPSYEDLLDEGKALMLARVDLAIPEEVYFEEEVEASSWPCPSSRATFLRNYTLERGGKRIAIASTQWSLVDIESRKILKVSDADFSNYWMSDYIELLPHKFKIAAADVEKMESAGPVGYKIVAYGDLDYNGHMNNTYYLDMICDYIPELAAGTHRVSGMRIHYSKEAPLGEKIAIYRTEAELSEDERQACERYSVPAEKKYVFRTVNMGCAGAGSGTAGAAAPAAVGGGCGEAQKQDSLAAAPAPELNIEAEIVITPRKDV